MLRFFMSLWAMTLGALLIAGAMRLYAQAPAVPTDPCRTVREQLDNYAVLLSRAQVAIREAQDQAAEAKAALAKKEPEKK